MWGYSCGAAVTGSTATCATLNPRCRGVLRLVAGGDHGALRGTGTSLTINLTNSLTFTVRNRPTSCRRRSSSSVSWAAVWERSDSDCAARCDLHDESGSHHCPVNRHVAHCQQHGGRPERPRRKGRACSRSAPKWPVGTTRDGSDLEQPEARHLPDRVRHASLDPGADGTVRNAGGHDCSGASGRLPDAPTPARPHRARDLQRRSSAAVQ